jgi:hypothetical protein
MFLTLDFNKSTRAAFSNGFLKGLAAPVMLYNVEPPPPIPQVTMIQAPSYPVAEAFARDWAAIAGDLQTAINRYAG